MTDDRKRIAAEQIRRAMINKGLSRKELSDKMGKNPSEITRWLSGEHNFTIGLLSQISEALECEITGVKLVDGYAPETKKNDAIMADSATSGVLTLHLPYSCILNLKRKATQARVDMVTYAQQVLISDTCNLTAKAMDFCGIWGDEDFSSADQMTKTLRKVRTSNKLTEL